MSLENNLSRNIRSLREHQGVTQEQLAAALHIAYQSVSKWETGVTVPDTMMLPRIAQFFGVSIDDLFCPETKAYANEAQRLHSVYEQSHDQNDFIRADAEYRKLFESGDYTLDDVRCYGVLYEYHMYYCRDKALEQYDKIIDSQVKDNVYFSARQQKSLLLSRIGRSEESIADAKEKLEKDPEDVRNAICLIAAYHCAERYEEGLAALRAAEEKFPAPNFLLYTYGGDICAELKRYDEAFSYWTRAMELGEEYIDPLYSMAFCHHELGQYEEEIAMWQRIIDWLMKRGCVHEAVFPKEQIKKARDMMLAGNQ